MWKSGFKRIFKACRIDQIIRYSKPAPVDVNENAKKNMFKIRNLIFRELDLKSARRYFDSLDHTNNENVDAYVYGPLLDAYAQLGYTEETLKLFNQMKQNGIKPTRVTYNFLVKLYVQTKKYSLIEDLVNNETEFSPGTDTLNILLADHVGHKSAKNVFKYYEDKIRKYNIKPDYDTIVILASHFGKISALEALNKTMLIAEQNNIFPDEKLMDVLVKSYLKCDDTGEALINYFDSLSPEMKLATNHEIQMSSTSMRWKRRKVEQPFNAKFNKKMSKNKQ
ncbi:pentatricopeptide repeat-containing protein [Acrasis kona]|uniref:Pentatricopeptide repeat-containing protein n=1 Tax=Acrasis kona TaxID=1008807 RepID=A0AAW2YLX1_9EUKA